MTTFARLFVPEPLRDAVSDAAWLDGMVDFERGLANALSLAGAIPASAAAAVAAECDASLYDVDELCEQGRATGNPAEPLVRALRERVGGDAARYVHFGATSQDVLDSAAMLVTRNATRVIGEELDALASACAALAEEHRATVMAARTLLQQAVPTTFGLKAAGWLVALVDARDRLRAIRPAVQLGGAAGTLAALGAHGAEVVRLLALELELEEPLVPWHAHRGRIVELGSVLDAVAGAAAKIAQDVVLLAQTEVGEVSEGPGGASSTMPQKQNPVQAVLARACARAVHAQVSVLTGGVLEHERAAGDWHAEWNALSEALAFTGGAIAATRACLEGLEVHPERMSENMTGGLFAERDALAAQGLADGDDAYLGSADVFVDRALQRYRAGQ